MPASAIPIGVLRRGSYVILEAALPERPVRNIGVLLVDSATGRGWARLREKYDDFASDEDAEVLEALEAELPVRFAESGAAYLEWLEDSLSNAVRVSERREV